MKRLIFSIVLAVTSGALLIGPVNACAHAGAETTQVSAKAMGVESHDESEREERAVKSKKEWKAELTELEYRVMFEEATERAHSSPLLKEKRSGTYACAACGARLFDADAKYESGTGWPSFFQPLPGAVETKTDYKILFPRTEYHCAKCGAHLGHRFDDGPNPTGERYCNNGVALSFVPDGDASPDAALSGDPPPARSDAAR